MKCQARVLVKLNVSRSPYGERGLKWIAGTVASPLSPSLSLRRAWIEIPWPVTAFIRISSRSPYGERGLKFALNRAAVSGSRRSPYGERGLKFIAVSWIVVSALVALLTESVD